MKLSLLAVLSFSVFISIGATSSNKKISEQEATVIQEEENKRLGFVIQLEKIENDRLDSDSVKKQEAVVEAKVVEIAEKAEAERIAEEGRLAEEQRLTERQKAKEFSEKRVTQSTQQVAKVTGKKVIAISTDGNEIISQNTKSS